MLLEIEPRKHDIEITIHNTISEPRSLRDEPPRDRREIATPISDATQTAATINRIRPCVIVLSS